MKNTSDKVVDIQNNYTKLLHQSILLELSQMHVINKTPEASFRSNTNNKWDLKYIKTKET